MFIISSGAGFVAVLIPAIVIMLMLALGACWWDGNDNANAYRVLGITFGIGCGLSAVALWFLGRWMNRPRKDDLGISHTCFFIPVQYWAFLWAGLGVFTTVRLLMG
jgi:hypothetical protein